MKEGRWGAAELFAVAWVAVQVGLPVALLLLAERPAPLGWQMYSATRAFPEVRAEGPAGELRVVELDRFVPRPRAEVEYSVLLPPFLCRELPGTVAVRVRTGDEPEARYPCP